MADSNDSSKNSKNLLVWIIVVFVFIGAIAIFVVSFQKNTKRFWNIYLDLSTMNMIF